jgi:hypothetical protein
MICKADTVGVFQIESRAQMSMLPRLKPRCYYDLVIEVAIVRPGPIQGNMVHPFIKRRNKQEPITYASPEIEKVLSRTLGVPLFREQAMALAVVAAGFTPGESDQLRRAIASWKRSGSAIKKFEHKLITGMRDRGHSQEFAEQVFQQISDSADTASPSRTLRASRCWSTPRAGSSGIIPRPSRRLSSTASRWDFISPPRSSAMRRTTASRSDQWTSIAAGGIARLRPRPAARRSGWGCGR